MLQHSFADLQRQIANRHQVFVRLGWEADHVIELQVLDAAREDEFGAVQDLVVRHRLVDDAAQAVRTGFGRNRNGALTALAQQAYQRLGQVVQTERRGADAVAHFGEPGQNPLDVRMVAEGNRHQSDASSVRSCRLGQLQDAIGRKRANRQVVVACPAKPAEVRASAHDLDEEARSEFRVGRKDAGRRRIDGLGGSERGLVDRHWRVGEGHGHVAGQRPVRCVLRLIERRDVEAALECEQPQQVGPVGRGRKCATQRRDERFALAGSDHVGKQRQRLRIDECDGAANDDERVARRPLCRAAWDAGQA